MSRLYDNYEPTVIDKQLLNDAILSLLKKGTVSELAKQDGIHFENVTHLRLDYKSKRVSNSIVMQLTRHFKNR